MKNFKFLNRIDSVERRLHNGVTDQYLIELSEQIWNISDWIYTTMLVVDEDTGQDTLIFEFKDIDQNSYYCMIYEDLSFNLKSIIDVYTEDEYLEVYSLSENISNDHTKILDYLRKMPKTIKSFL